MGIKFYCIFLANYLFNNKKNSINQKILFKLKRAFKEIINQIKLLFDN